jgi:hypothetical protein
MNKIGNYAYPEKTSFKEALSVAQEAITKYAGTMPNDKVAIKLGHDIKNPDSISGWIYRRFDDICLFGLTERNKGAVKSTSLAEKALDPNDEKRASEGKAEAIRNVQIIAKAFDEWNGEIPTETAFPAKIGELTNVSWVEAQKHAETLRNLFIETFPYLKSVPGIPGGGSLESGGEGDEMESKTDLGSLTINAREQGFTFSKTLPFNKGGLESLKKLIDFLETQINPEEEKKTNT